MSRPIYIIHGWTYSIKPWTPTVSVLRSWGYEVHQLCVPGLTSPSEKVWTIDEYVEWLKKELEGVKDPIVVGHSNGGRIAMNYLVKYPDSFHQLALLNSAGTEVAAQRLSWKRTVLRVLSKILRPLRSVPLLRKFVYRLLRSDYNAAPENMKKTLANMLASDKHLTPEKISVPTAIVWGEIDSVTPLAMGKKLHDLIKNSTFVSFKNWGHAPYITHPYQLAQALHDVMRQK